MIQKIEWTSSAVIITKKCALEIKCYLVLLIIFLATSSSTQASSSTMGDTELFKAYDTASIVEAYSKGDKLKNDLFTKNEVHSKWIESPTHTTSSCSVGSYNDAAAQIDIRKIVSRNDVDIGRAFTYTLQFSCLSLTENCDDVVITDFLPTELNYLGAASSLTQSTIAFNNGVITVSFSSGNGTGLNAGISGEIIIQVSVKSGTPPIAITNTANIASSNAGTDVASVIINVNDSSVGGGGSGSLTSGLQAHKFGVGAFTPGGYVNYGLRYYNTGATDINDVDIVDNIPPQVTLHNVRIVGNRIFNESYTLYYMRDDIPNTWHVWTTGSNNRTNHLFVSDLSLPVSVDITAIRIRFDVLPGDGRYLPSASRRGLISIDGIVKEVDRNGSVVRTDDVINNCNTISSSAYYDIHCIENIVIDSAAHVYADKVISEGNNSFPGSTLTFQVEAGLDYSVLTTDEYTISDLLPIGIDYQPGSWFIESYPVNQREASFPIPIFESINNYNGTGRTLVRWSWSKISGNNLQHDLYHDAQLFNIEFQASTSSNFPGGDYTNCVAVFTSATSTICSRKNSTSQVDIYDLDGDGDMTESYCQECADFTITAVPSLLNADIWVKGELNNDFLRFPSIANTTRGGRADYKILIDNPTTTAVGNILIVDVFPVPGDQGVIIPIDRQSEYSPYLIDVITPPAGGTVEYSTVNNPCRDELDPSDDGIPNNFPSGCNAANWSINPPLDLTTVSGVRIDLNSIILNQNDTVEISWPMIVPSSSVPNDIAWNSFGYRASNLTSVTDLLPSEPIKVGISTRQEINFLGNYVWDDSNGNGIQDISENGMDGVRVSLIEDTNNNGTLDATDIEYSWTRTTDGGQYIFSNYPADNYFISFTELPSDYTATISNTGSDDDKDSDGAIIGPFAASVIDAITHLDFGVTNIACRTAFTNPHVMYFRAKD